MRTRSHGGRPRGNEVVIEVMEQAGTPKVAHKLLYLEDTRKESLSEGVDTDNTLDFEPPEV